MSWRSSVSDALRWIRTLGRNPYFWGGLGVLLVLGGILYVSFNAFLMPSYTRHDVAVTVPDLENRPFEEAAQVVDAYGLRVERQVGRYNPNVPQGTVVDQNPPPQSSVKPGRRVYLTVNSGRAPTVKIPDLSGTSLREAKNRLTALGLEVGRVRADSVPSPYPNTVTRQRPEPGDSLKTGNAVDLWYSQGLGTSYAQVPDLRGLPVDAARQRLLARKLRSVVVDASAGSDEADASAEGSPSTGAERDSTARFVRDQGREPGARVRAGTEIRLFTTSDSTRARQIRQRASPPDTSSAPEAPDTSDTGFF